MRSVASRARLAALVVLAPLVVWCVPRPRLQPAAPSSEDLVVMTYNVNYGLEGDRSGLEAIRRGAADVVLLQETNPGWEQTLRGELHGIYPFMQFAHSDRWPAGGLGVLSRFPFEVRDVSPSPEGWFFAWRVMVHAPAADVQVLNVHLRPAISDDGSVVKGYFTTPAVRRRELEHHVKLLEPAIPALVVGDFNEDEAGAASAVLAALGMRSALPDFEPDQTTWRWPVGPFTIRRRFDHIFYAPASWVCVGARVVDAGRSDHLPVVVRLRLREPTPPPGASAQQSRERGPRAASVGNAAMRYTGSLAGDTRAAYRESPVATSSFAIEFPT
jgi:endonuclease/exonuclease/phosphatase family metal-dependent hydrolase